MSLGALSLDSRDLLLLLGDAWKEGMEGGKRPHLEPGAELDALKFKVPPQLILKTRCVCVRTNFLLREKKEPRG